MHKSFIIFFILVFGVKSLVVSQISRTQIINNSIPYTNFSWTASSCNFWSGTNCGGRNVFSVPTYSACPSKGWLVIGSNTSMPYMWGGWSTTTQHINAMSNCRSAGDICSSGCGGNCSGDGSGLSQQCASGHDCSGLVSRAWARNSKESTSSLPSISSTISLSASQPGDIVNIVRNHTRLIETNYGNGNYRVIEASGTDWKTAYHTYTTLNLSSYTTLCPNSSIVTGGCGTPCSPPSNDNCVNAIQLTPSSTCNYQSYSSNCASQSIAATSPCNNFTNGNADDDVWFRFSAIAGQTYSIRLLNGTGFDGVLDVRSGSCNGTSVGCDDQTGSTGVLNTVTYTSPSNQTLYARVYHYGTGSGTGGGNFQICVINTSQPTCTDQFESNNSPSTSTLVFSNPLSTNSSNYTIQGNIGFVDDVDWYRVNMQACGNLTVNLTNLPRDYDLELWNAAANNVIDGSYSSGTNSEQVTFSSTSSSQNTVYLKVYPYNPNDFTTSSCYSMQFLWTPSNCPCTTPTQPSSINGQNLVCQGSSQSYSVNAVSGATDYTWTLPSGWSGSSNTNSIPTTVGSAGGNITVTANNSCGSSTPRTLPVTVNQVPAQPGSIAGATSVCQGSSQSYSVSTISGATDYIWSLPSGWSGSSNTNSISATVGSSGGNISVIARNNCGSSAPRSQPVTVNQTPSVSVNPSSASVCSGGSGIVLQASGNAQNYSWSPSTGLNTTTGTTVTATPNITTTYTVTGSNGNCSASATSTVTVSGQLSASITPTNPQLCENGSVALTASQGSAYSWSGPAGFTANSRVINVSVPGLYSVIVTNPGGCTGSASANVSVTSAPVLNVNAGSDRSIQPGESTQLGGSPTAVGGSSPYSYAWSPSQYLNNTNVSNPLANPSATTNYNVTVTDAKGCSKSDNVLVTVVSACQYTLETLIKNIPANSGAHSIGLTTSNGCNWTVDEGCSWLDFNVSSGSGSTSLIFTVSANTQATPRTCFINIQGNLLQVVQAGACLPPLADFNVSQQAGFAPLTVTFFDNSSNSPNEWLWSFPGGSPTFSGERNPVVTYNSGGIYDVTLLSRNDCGENTISKSKYMNVIVTTGLFNNQGGEIIQIYPNPNNGTFNLVAEVKSGEKAYLNLIATNGQFVYSEVLFPVNTTIQREISVNNLISGMYIVQLVIDQEVYYGKVVIEKW
jgi:PKD repeat protein